MPKKRLKGKIISNKMKKTLVVRVEQLKEHTKYKRRFKVHKNYKVHFDEGEYNIGDKLIIEECKPISRDKRWKVVKKFVVNENKNS